MKSVYIVTQIEKLNPHDPVQHMILRVYDHRDDAVAYTQEIENAAQTWPGTQWFEVKEHAVRGRK
jgi:hypothetical protein